MIVEIIFSPSAGNMALKTVTFKNVASVYYNEGGLGITHNDLEGVLYFYPYHTIGRIKEING